MEAPNGKDIRSVALNSEEFIPQLATDKLRLLKAEMEDILDEFDREYAISFLAGNFATNTHLCVVILRGKHDDEIREITGDVMSLVEAEIASRRRH